MDSPNRALGADLAQTVVSVLERCLAGATRPVALHEPWFRGNEWAYVKECIDTRWVSTAGSFVGRFEEQLAVKVGVKHAIAAVNGTAALHVCLLQLGVQSGDEVLLPTLTFVATANSVSYCGAMPHFVDSDEQTLGVSAAKLRAYLNEIGDRRGGGLVNRVTGRRIRCLIVMHTFGHPSDMQALGALCREFELGLVEDATEALGSAYKGRSMGGWGQIAALSFNGNKIVTTGGGGAVLTDDDTLAKTARHLMTTARSTHRWEFIHDTIGFNYRLPNINSALGCAQLENLDVAVARKRALAERYRAGFTGVPGLRFFTEPANCRSNYWLNAILLDDDMASFRDKVLEATNDAGLLTRPSWVLMHRLPMYAQCPRMTLDTAEGLASRIVNLPSSAFL